MKISETSDEIVIVIRPYVRQYRYGGFMLNFVKISETSDEIVIVIRPHVRQYSYGGFMLVN